MRTLSSGALRAGIVLLLLTGAASAQLPMPGITLSPDRSRVLTPEEKEKQKAIDDQYRATIKQIPDKRTSDPWGNMRSTPADSSRR